MWWCLPVKSRKWNKTATTDTRRRVTGNDGGWVQAADDHDGAALRRRDSHFGRLSHSRRPYARIALALYLAFFKLNSISLGVFLCVDRWIVSFSLSLLSLFSLTRCVSLWYFVAPKDLASHDVPIELAPRYTLLLSFAYSLIRSFVDSFFLKHILTINLFVCSEKMLASTSSMFVSIYLTLTAFLKQQNH